MFETIANFFKKLKKSEKEENSNSKTTAKERLHLVLMQDRANVSADFLELMKQEIIEVIKKYIDVEEEAIDVRLTNKVKDDGTTGAPFLYANIPIVNIKNDLKKDAEQKENEDEKNVGADDPVRPDTEEQPTEENKKQEENVGADDPVRPDTEEQPTEENKKQENVGADMGSVNSDTEEQTKSEEEKNNN